MINNSCKRPRILYLGFNNMFKHKRGVENVIDFQSKAGMCSINYYIHWDDKTHVYKYKGFICVGIKSNYLKYFVFNWIILKIKKKEQNIFIHSHNTLMTMVCIFKTNLFTVHDALYYQNKCIGHKLKILFYVLEKFLYTRINFVHFISYFSMKMSLYKKADKFKVIYNTSFLEGYTVKKVAEQRIRFNPSKTKVFVVRSIEERSRIDLIIEAAKQKALINVEIFIAGKGELYAYYKNEIQQLNLKNIQLLGYINDKELVNYYLDCDLVLMPAEYAEGFGLPIIEGYLFNKPVIASNKCAIPEVIISEDYLFENTTQSLIHKIEMVRDEKLKPFKTYYDNNFSNVHILGQMNKLYNSLI